MADDFEKKNPNVKIEIPVLWNASYKQRLADVIKLGNPPDIFINSGGRDMIEYAKAAPQGYNERPRWNRVGQFMRSRSAGVYAYQGKNYGIPYSMGEVGIWYKKRIFEKVGIKPFETWDDTIEGVKKLKATGITPIALGGETSGPDSSGGRIYPQG